MLKDKLALLPEYSGCYLMKDKDNTIIYVGKAKNLRNRVKSYFTGSHNAKTTLLVSEIVDFEYIRTNSELEAFILELHLIKEHSPKYNIQLMDDKTYPYIVLTNELYPRLIVSRDPSKKLGKKYGPYPNVLAARETVRLLNNVYPLRKCYNIPKKECLYYHLKQCLGPCINKIDPQVYDDYLTEITSFLKGNIKEMVTNLNRKMLELSDNLEFEQAQECKNMILYIKRTVEKQKIELSDYVDRDIIGFYHDEEDICIHIFFMREGAIVAHKTEIMKNVIDPTDEVISYIAKYYENNYVPKEIFTKNLDLNILHEIVPSDFITPQKGEKKRLLDLAFQNAEMDLLKNRELYRNRHETKMEALNSLETLLGISPLKRMEIFDNSNIMGINPVSACVVYVDGSPSKKDYRKYTVKTVKGANDFETMKEIIYRRYYRMLMDNLERPSLIVMDGGEIQVHAASEIIDSLGLDIPIIGLKKDENHKTDSIVYLDQDIPLDRHSLVYRLLFNMQEEVHRFAISFHRDTRSKGMLLSVLDTIPGIGKTRRNNLLKTFSSFEEILMATDDDFKNISINKELGQKIKDSLKEYMEQKEEKHE